MLSYNETENFTILDLNRNQIQIWPNQILLFIYSLVFILGFLGNLLTIYLVIFFKKIQSMTNKFISNLALADLLVILIVIPENVIRLMNPNDAFHETSDRANHIFCKLTVFVHGN